MALTPGHSLPGSHVVREADVASWARLLDEHPLQIQRAIGQAGTDLGAIRRYLFSRQLGLDFDGITAADASAGAVAQPPG